MTRCLPHRWYDAVQWAVANGYWADAERELKWANAYVRTANQLEQDQEYQGHVQAYLQREAATKSTDVSGTTASSARASVNYDDRKTGR